MICYFFSKCFMLLLRWLCRQWKIAGCKKSKCSLWNEILLICTLDLNINLREQKQKASKLREMPCTISMHMQNLNKALFANRPFPVSEIVWERTRKLTDFANELYHVIADIWRIKQMKTNKILKHQQQKRTL